jgi:hypothetical protein
MENSLRRALSLDLSTVLNGEALREDSDAPQLWSNKVPACGLAIFGVRLVLVTVSFRESPKLVRMLNARLT